MIKLIATDMDGTLVNDKGSIDERIFDLIHTLNEKGIEFAAASGRFYSQLNHNFKKVKKDMIFIAHNGALIRYNNNGKIIYSNCISKEDLDHVINLEPKCGQELFLAGESTAYVVNPSKNMMNEFNFFGVPSIIVNSYDEINSPIYKITYYMPEGIKPSMIEYLKNNLNDSLEFVVSGDRWIDIMNKGISKGSAIKILHDKFKIDEKNTMVFGDYYNDLTMFKRAFYSYAMENAPEDVKKYANFVAESNNKNGVYNTVYKYVTSL